MEAEEIRCVWFKRPAVVESFLPCLLLLQYQVMLTKKVESAITSYVEQLALIDGNAPIRTRVPIMPGHVKQGVTLTVYPPPHMIAIMTSESNPASEI